MSGRGIVEAEVFRTEQVSRLARTSDPTSPAKGDAWIRTDVQPVTNSVAALRIQGDSGVLEAPLFDPSATTGSDVYVGKRFLFDDGTEGHLLVTDQGGAVGSPRVVTSSGTLYEAHDSLDVNVIPDSVVSRPQDNTSSSSGFPQKRGVRISVSQEWTEIQGELSGNVDSALTRAYIHRVSDGMLMGDVGISGTAGEVFTVELDTPLSSGEEYNFVCDAGGSDYITAYYDSPSFPYTSSDGNLEIVDGALEKTDTVPNAFNILTVGNINL